MARHTIIDKHFGRARLGSGHSQSDGGCTRASPHNDCAPCPCRCMPEAAVEGGPAVQHATLTCLPRPLPPAAPSMMPGRSSSWIFASRYCKKDPAPLDQWGPGSILQGQCWTTPDRASMYTTVQKIGSSGWGSGEHTSMFPGMHVRVVNSYPAHSLSVAVTDHQEHIHTRTRTRTRTHDWGWLTSCAILAHARPAGEARAQNEQKGSTRG